VLLGGRELLLRQTGSPTSAPTSTSASFGSKEQLGDAALKGHQVSSPEEMVMGLLSVSDPVRTGVLFYNYGGLFAGYKYDDPRQSGGSCNMDSCAAGSAFADCVAADLRYCFDGATIHGAPTGFIPSDMSKFVGLTRFCSWASTLYQARYPE
jgi:hypothetical protein